MEERPEYRVARIDGDFLVPGKPSFWNALPVTTIDHYLWLDNGYRPRVEIRACYSRRYLYLFFKVFESKIRARFTGFQNPVYKDSCVELFIDPFPEKTIGYINLETNVIDPIHSAASCFCRSQPSQPHFDSLSLERNRRGELRIRKKGAFKFCPESPIMRCCFAVGR